MLLNKPLLAESIEYCSDPKRNEYDIQWLLIYIQIYILKFWGLFTIATIILNKIKPYFFSSI